MIHVDVYAVGLLESIKHKRIRRSLRYLKSQIRARNWRAVRSHFNGYLAEHDGCHHDCGRGWTQRAASRRASALCRSVDA